MEVESRPVDIGRAGDRRAGHHGLEDRAPLDAPDDGVDVSPRDEAV